MAIPRWCKDTIIRIRPGTKTSRGSTIPDWENLDTLEIGGCSVQPASTGLSQDGRVLGISEGMTCFFPPETDIAAGDKIRYEGKEYQIIGEPKTWKSPTGRVSSIQASIERWAG